MFPKLFVTDLDDTALGGGFKPYSRFPDIFSVFLDRLKQRGCDWATNTTWDVNPQVQLIYGSAVESRPLYIVGGKGLQLYTMYGDEAVGVEPYCRQMNEKLEGVCKLHLRPLIKDICSRFDLKNIMFNGFWFSAVAVDRDAPALLSYVKKKARLIDSLCFKTYPERNQLGVFPEYLKKSVALREILRITGLKPEEVVVAGDGLIDLDMMADDLSGHVLCPGNAHHEVKAWVAKRNGIIGEQDCGPGIIEAFGMLAERNDWDWDFDIAESKPGS